jgi:acyl carrier protein
VLRRRLNELKPEGIDPQKLWEVAESHGYAVQVSCGTGDHPECYQALLLHATRAPAVSGSAMALPSPEARPWSAYANDPLESGFRQTLVPQLREYLKTRLPEYMIPSAWSVLKQLPLTPNGKLDRSALPPPQARLEDLGEYIAPRTEVELALAEIWAQLLQVDQVGLHDNFFELGGHSLHGIKLVSMISERLGVRLAVIAVFRHPTVHQMAAFIEAVNSVVTVQQVASEASQFEEGII